MCIPQQHIQVHVFVAHLSLSREARERSVVEIWRYMQRFSGLSVFCGDLNAEPHEASMRYKISRKNLVIVSIRFCDSDVDLLNSLLAKFNFWHIHPLARFDFWHKHR